MRNLMMLILALTVTILSTTQVQADVGDQLFKLIAEDGQEDDHFGISLALNGKIAIVGVPDDDDNGIYSGSVYLFDTTTGQQTAKLQPNDAAANDHFGISVTIIGTTALIGAPGDDNDRGSVYLFDTITGQQLDKLIPENGYSSQAFGGSIAVSGSTAIIGASGASTNGLYSGKAYFFDITTGQQIAELLPNDGAAGDQFGRSVDINETTAIIGAFKNQDNGAFSGSAYLFKTSTGQQITKILPNDGSAYDQFGWSLAISDTIAIVGARYSSDNGSDSGSAYLFDAATGHQITKLLANDGSTGDSFGHSVAISENIAIVGARYDNDNGNDSGSAYLFNINTRLQISKLLASDGSAYDRFGCAVSINSTTAIVGASRDDDNGFQSGSAYLFDAEICKECPWDLDYSCAVGTGDLLALFALWGIDSPADFDGSGTVDESDILILLANWGPCE